jgi:hypothetical protein
MATDSNRHELLTNGNLHEMEEQEKQSVLMNPLGELNNTPYHPTETYELEPNSRILGPELNPNEYPSLYELETSTKPAAAAPYITPSGPGSPVSRKPVAQPVSASKEKEDEGMRILQDRIERIRAEKERLQKIQELELLEEETKQAILEKGRLRDGSGSGNRLNG